jgi:MoxR-like ATPase
VYAQCILVIRLGITAGSGRYTTGNLAVGMAGICPGCVDGDYPCTALYAEYGPREMVFQPGPVFTNILLADEINRASPKTQSAMLEIMQEHSVTLMGTTRKLPSPFFVLASQNPIELEGTYPLPEAQIDRFLFK